MCIEIVDGMVEILYGKTTGTYLGKIGLGNLKLGTTFEFDHRTRGGRERYHKLLVTQISRDVALKLTLRFSAIILFTRVPLSKVDAIQRRMYVANCCGMDTCARSAR